MIDRIDSLDFVAVFCAKGCYKPRCLYHRAITNPALP